MGIHTTNGEIVHYTYLGKYLNLSYILKRKKTQLKPKTKFQIIKKKGFHKGDTTRILKTDKNITNSFFSNYSNDYKINFNVSIPVPLKMELNDNESAVIGKGGKTLPLMKISKGQACECGCKDIAIDHDHGETFCAHCGLILDSSISSEFLEGT